MLSSAYYAHAAELHAQASQAFFARTKRRLRAQARDMERAGWAASQAERAERASAWDAEQALRQARAAAWDRRCR
jgi:hypothetical protein